MKDSLYEVRYLKSSEDMILALVRQFKQLSHEPEKFRIISSLDFKYRTSYNLSFIETKFVYLRRNNCTETYFSLLLRMATMEMYCILKNFSFSFSKFLYSSSR